MVRQNYLACSSFSQSSMWPRERSRLRPRLGQLESRIQRVFQLLLLVDAGQLLGFGRQLRLSAWPAARAVAQLQLREHGLKLLMGDLLLEAGNLRLGVQFAQAAGEFGDLNLVLPLRLFGLDRGSERLGRRLLGLGAMPKSKSGIRNENPELKLLAGIGCA
jgi:hypothetical protein